MLLNGDEILKARRAGEIVIDPFLTANINSHSYDVSLGPFYYQQRPYKTWWLRKGFPTIISDTNVYNPYDEQHTKDAWELCRADEASLLGYVTEGIGRNDLVIPIGPKEIILAHTLEFIGSVPRPEGISITTMMHSRSSSVRSCIDVCGSGGFGDAGFCSRWCMEIVNTSPHYFCYLVVGRRIAQISFHRTEPIQRDYAQEGKYHAGLSLEELREKWHPSMMLPRVYQDREVGKPNRHRKLINQLIKKYPIGKQAGGKA